LGRRVFLWVSHILHPRGRGLNDPIIFGRPIPYCIHTVWPKSTKLGIMGEMSRSLVWIKRPGWYSFCLWVPWPAFQRVGPGVHTFWTANIHAHGYVKRQPEFAYKRIRWEENFHPVNYAPCPCQSFCDTNADVRSVSDSWSFCCRWKLTSQLQQWCTTVPSGCDDDDIKEITYALCEKFQSYSKRLGWHTVSVRGYPALNDLWFHSRRQQSTCSPSPVSCPTDTVYVMSIAWPGKFMSD